MTSVPEGRALVVARVPRELRLWRPELAYGLYLARRAQNWSAAGRYPRENFANTRFVLPLEVVGELERFQKRYKLPRYVILTVALHNLSRDRLATPPRDNSAVVRPLS